MVKPLSVLVISVLLLNSCSTVRDSRVNPFNWFGGGQSEPAPRASGDPNNPLIPAPRRDLLGLRQVNNEPPYEAPPIAQVSELVIERRSGGAIVRATGVADVLGPFDVRLTPVETDTPDGTLTFEMRAYQQPGPRGASPEARSATAALWLSDQDLAGIRAIRVAGRDNAQVSRR